MKINWVVRCKNQKFWECFIPLALLLIQKILALFGVEIDLGGFGNKLLEIIGIVFGILGLLGVVVDPTTPGVDDSERAMTYIEPGVPGKE